MNGVFAAIERKIDGGASLHDGANRWDPFL